LNPMTPTTATILLYLVALSLTVATLWLLSLTQTSKKTDPHFVWVLIVVVLPFVMLFYFGLAFLIDDTVSEGAAWATANEGELSFTESLVATVSYVGLSGWLWLRWRNPIAPSTKILGPAIIATVSVLIIVSVIWAVGPNILNAGCLGHAANVRFGVISGLIAPRQARRTSACRRGFQVNSWRRGRAGKFKATKLFFDPANSKATCARASLERRADRDFPPPGRGWRGSKGGPKRERDRWSPAPIGRALAAWQRHCYTSL
jgi:hypothetical protein